MLDLTKSELELIPDPDMYIFFEKGATVGDTYISNRCSKVNNKYLKSYNPKQESKHIIYIEIYMVIQCLSFFKRVASNGYIQKSLS